MHSIDTLLFVFSPSSFQHQWFAESCVTNLDAKVNVRIGDVCGAVFVLLSGVRQGCPVSPIFVVVTLAFVSWIFRIIFVGIKLVSFYLSPIEYADDQIVFACTPGGLQEIITFLADTALPLGLSLAPQKCEHI